MSIAKNIFSLPLALSLFFCYDENMETNSTSPVSFQKEYIFRGRKFNQEDIQVIKGIAEKYSNENKTKIIKVVCETFNWRQPNGYLKDMACREALERMNKIGLISLPPIHPGYYRRRRRTSWKEMTDMAIPEVEIKGLNFDNVELRMVRWTEQEKRWNYLIDKYHYLGYRTPVGHCLKYLIYCNEKILGCIGFTDGVLKLNIRDKWIGWSIEQRERNLRFVINNNRFLLLPWVKVKNLASKVLSIATKQVQKDWEHYYNYKPVLIETFVDVGRFIGTCYKASNWHFLGRTIGKGRRGMKYFIHNQPKDTYVCPLCKDYLRWLKCY